VQKSYKGLLVGAAMMLGGAGLFFAFLALIGIDPDEQRLGLVHWMIGGALIGPGFGKMTQWRQTQGRPPATKGSSEPS